MRSKVLRQKLLNGQTASRSAATRPPPPRAPPAPAARLPRRMTVAASLPKALAAEDVNDPIASHSDHLRRRSPDWSWKWRINVDKHANETAEHASSHCSSNLFGHFYGTMFVKEAKSSPAQAGLPPSKNAVLSLAPRKRRPRTASFAMLDASNDASCSDRSDPAPQVRAPKSSSKISWMCEWPELAASEQLPAEKT